MAGNIFPYNGFTPKVHETAWVAPTAVLIGNVEVGAGASIWYGCVLRGDNDVLHIGARTNIQDGTVIHIDRGVPCHIGDDVTVGHMALIHACTLEDGSFVGMKSTVMNEVVVEGGGMVAAGALVAPGKRIKRGELWAGVPAKFWRNLSEEEVAGLGRTAESYARKAKEYRAVFDAPGR